MLPELPPKHVELVEAEKTVRTIRAQRQAVERELEAIQPCETLDLDDVAERIASGTFAEVTVPDAATDLQRQIDVLSRAGRKAQQRLTAERERHNKQIVRAFRSPHRAAARAILKALEALVAANAAELEIRRACPVPLVGISFPHVGGWGPNNVGIARHWRDYVSNLGFLEPDEPEPATRPKRGLFAGRGNGAEPAPMAAKSVE